MKVPFIAVVLGLLAIIGLCLICYASGKFQGQLDMIDKLDCPAQKECPEWDFAFKCNPGTSFYVNTESGDVYDNFSDLAVITYGPKIMKEICIPEEERCKCEESE